MKKRVFIIIGIIIILALVYLIGTGFIKNTSVYIDEYSLSADGKEMTIHVGVGSSIGFIRDVKATSKDDGRLYLDFYSAFGGINGSFGAKNTFTIKLDDNTKIISISRDKGIYEDFLIMGEDGSWKL